MERESENESDKRQYLGHGRPRRRFRRFIRRDFPLATLPGELLRGLFIMPIILRGCGAVIQDIEKLEALITDVRLDIRELNTKMDGIKDLAKKLDKLLSGLF